MSFGQRSVWRGMGCNGVILCFLIGIAACVSVGAAIANGDELAAQAGSLQIHPKIHVVTVHGDPEKLIALLERWQSNVYPEWQTSDHAKQISKDLARFAEGARNKRAIEFEITNDECRWALVTAIATFAVTYEATEATEGKSAKIKLPLLVDKSAQRFESPNETWIREALTGGYAFSPGKGGCNEGLSCCEKARRSYLEHAKPIEGAAEPYAWGGEAIDGPRPSSMPPKKGDREFDGGPDFGNGSWAERDEDGVWRRYGG
ncbi:MAG: hypothetical protein ACO1RT_10240 [Planctomycetaceae bacterium]